MKVSKKQYEDFVKKAAPPSPIFKNCILAFLIGGGICAFGEVLLKLYEYNSVEEINGIFIAQGVATSTDFAKKLGAMIENNYIVVNEKMETTIPNIYACGDCTGGLLQISKAVYEGAVAGLEVIKKLKKM